jgi:hypothetical protein
MPHSLRVKIKNLRYKGIITDKDCDRLCKALDNENVLDKIRAEIEQTRKMYLDMNDIDWLNGCDYVLSVIDKYKAESEDCESGDSIKALDQEDAIEKIRAEVESINVWALRYAPTYDEDIRPQIVSNVKEHVLEIIDKYKEDT